jgi:hypothetical protein
MNISPPRGEADPPAAPPDWTIELKTGREGKHEYLYADVRRGGQLMFRVGIGGIAEEAKARKLLANQARTYIDEYLNRESRLGLRPQDT